MIKGVENELFYNIEKLVNIIIEVLNYDKLDNSQFEKYKLMDKNEKIKNIYFEKQKSILERTKEIANSINCGRAMSIALFIVRDKCKKIMYERNEGISENASLIFKISNAIFLNFIKEKNLKEENINNDEIRYAVSQYYNLMYCYIYNIDKYNKSINGVDDEGTKDFYDDLIKVSNMNEDMNSYKIKNIDIADYLNRKTNFNIDYIKQNIGRTLKKSYYRKSIIETDKKLFDSIQRDKLKIYNNEITIIEKSKIIFYGKRFNEFIKKFSATGNEDLEENQNELIFSYIDKNYVIISDFIMKNAQHIINFSLEKNQYPKLVNYYFGFNEIEANKNIYNKIMTYKVADLLLSNSYKVPLQKVKKDKTNKIDFPLIDIIKYPGYKNEYGDLDVLFLSPFTNTLYIIEYKNFQMMVSRKEDLSDDSYRVVNKDVITKVLRRETIIKDNVSECIKRYFEDYSKNVTVKSIILTTKPNFYFYKNEIKDYIYCDWTKFKEKVEEHIF